MKMIRNFTIASLLFLSACAGFIPAIKNPINNEILATSISVYGLSNTAFIAYRSLPRCTTSNLPTATNWCWKWTVVAEGQELDKNANKALNDAVNFTRNNPTLDASSYIEAAKLAVTNFKNFNTANGVQ